jgi:hypothetical protein
VPQSTMNFIELGCNVCTAGWDRFRYVSVPQSAMEWKYKYVAIACRNVSVRGRGDHHCLWQATEISSGNSCVPRHSLWR